MKKTNNKGFSLIELIIVIAIMAILVAIIAPNLTKYLGKSKKNTDAKNLDEIESTLKTCITDYEMESSDLISTGTADVSVVIQFASGGATMNSTDVSKLNGTWVSATPAVTDFKSIVDTAIESNKTKSKEDSSKYAKVTITKKTDGTYKIKAEF